MRGVRAHAKNGRGPASHARARVVARAELPTRFGRFTVFGIQGRGASEEAVAILHGRVKNRAAPLVRVHSQCLTGDVFASERCDCRAQLEFSLRKIAKEPAGIVWKTSSCPSISRSSAGSPPRLAGFGRPASGTGRRWPAVRPS